MKLKKNTLYVLGIVVICILGGYIFLSGTSPDVSPPSPVSTGDAQKVSLSMKNLNYYPQTIEVAVNVPVELTLDASVGGCFRSFVIPEFDVRAYSARPSDTIQFTPTKTGTFSFACSMGMGTGTLIVR